MLQELNKIKSNTSKGLLTFKWNCFYRQGKNLTLPFTVDPLLIVCYCYPIIMAFNPSQNSSLMFNIQVLFSIFKILMWTSHLTDSVTPRDLEVVYTKTEDAIDGVFWLATQTPPILYCSPLKNSCWICAQKYGNGCQNNWIKIIFLCNMISVTVSAHTYTTFHLSVGG